MLVGVGEAGEDGRDKVLAKLREMAAVGCDKIK